MSEPQSPERQTAEQVAVHITQQWRNLLQRRNTWPDRLYLPALLLILVLFSGWNLLAGDLAMTGIGISAGAALLILATQRPLQSRLLGRPFEPGHATYIFFAAAYLVLWVRVYRLVITLPTTGKESELFYIFAFLLVALTFRVLLTLFAITPRGFSVFISRSPLWEKILIALNEVIAACLLAYVGGGQLARTLQPQVFSLNLDPLYASALIGFAGLYYFAMQIMWWEKGNDWLGRNQVWVRFARLLGPLALIMASIVIGRHFTRLSDPRTADLVGTAELDQAVLAISPVIWVMIFFICLMVYSGNRGLRQRFLPDALVQHLSPLTQQRLSHLSDMVILLVMGFFAMSIPIQLLLFEDDNIGIIDTLRLQIAQQNALIDSSQQALALIFALPFYGLCVALLVLYAVVLARPNLPARTRNDLIDRLPISLLITFIITLYLCAIPFSQVLIEGRLPQLPQELGRVLAFDVLIPLILLYSHYLILVRLPYGRGQARWREQHALTLEKQLARTDAQIEALEDKLEHSQYLWARRNNLRANLEERLEMLYQFIDVNGERDRLNMERLRILAERQELAEVSETPISLTVARLPARMVSLGIPLLLAFKIYEWAIVNDGLREIANDPNIGVVEFFQRILEQTQF